MTGWQGAKRGCVEVTRDRADVFGTGARGRGRNGRSPGVGGRCLRVVYGELGGVVDAADDDEWDGRNERGGQRLRLVKWRFVAK